MGLSAGAIVGIVLGSIAGFLLLMFIMLLIVKLYLAGPNTGSKNPKRLDGKVVVITGANAGIGKETAKDMAKRGARVIILVRNAMRGENAIREMKEELKNESMNITMRLLDLSSLKSVRSCAQELLDNEEKIDILINNAGVAMLPQIKTEDGFDIQFGTNHLGHFLLTELLLPLIRKSAASGFHPRIVIVSSLGHSFGSRGMNWDDINWEGKDFDTTEAYFQSKLANVLHSKELAKRLNAEDAGISVYCVHPGAVNTELLSDLRGRNACFACVEPLMKFIAKTAHNGAQTSIYCALDDRIEHHSGRYYSDCAEKEPSPRALKEEDWRRLWDMSEEMVGLKA